MGYITFLNKKSYILERLFEPATSWVRDQEFLIHLGKTPLLYIFSHCAAAGACDHPGWWTSHIVQSGGPFFGPYPSGTVVSYTCHNGYSGGGSIICQSDGRWSHKPICIGTNAYQYKLSYAILFSSPNLISR